MSNPHAKALHEREVKIVRNILIRYGCFLPMTRGLAEDIVKSLKRAKLLKRYEP